MRMHWLFVPEPLDAHPDATGAPITAVHPMDHSFGVVNAHCPLEPQLDLSDTIAETPPCAGGPPGGGGNTVLMQ
jgi:hypothetical protein